MKHSILFVIICAFATGSLYSQGRIQQAEDLNAAREIQTNKLKEGGLTDDTVEDLYVGEEQDIGRQFIVKMKKRRRYFRAMADIQYFYTSNVFLQEEPVRGNEAEDTGVLLSTIEFALAPDPYQVGEGKLYPELGYRHQWFNYGLDDTANQLNNLDFDQQTVFASITYNIWEDWYFKVGFDWNRLLGHEPPTDDYAAFYWDYVPSYGVEKRWMLSDTQMFTASYDGMYHLSHTDAPTGIIALLGPPQPTNVNDRMDHMITLTYTHVFMDRLLVQPFYRFMYTDYDYQTNVPDGPNRGDILNQFGMTASWVFNDHFSARTYINYDNRQSEDINTVADYEKFDVGLGLSASVRF